MKQNTHRKTKTKKTHKQTSNWANKQKNQTSCLSAKEANNTDNKKAIKHNLATPPSRARRGLTTHFKVFK